jgi:carbamoyl-phosphate synthase large subunit
MTPKPLTLLRTAAGSPPTVTQYRAFQALGCRIVAVDCEPGAVGFHFADAAYRVPRVGAPGYLERMLEICAREGVELFLPALDEELQVCGRNRERFQALGTRLLLSGPRPLWVCADKLRMFQFFRACDLPTPLTVAAEDYGPGRFQRYPVIVKPRSGRGGAGVHLARSHAEAAFFCGYLGRAVVQERLEGMEYTIDVLASEASEVLILSARERLATESGVSSRGATRWRQELLAPVATLVRELALVGPVNIQAFVSAAGQLAFTEVNARLAGTAILSQAAGVPLFQGILALARGLRPEPWLKPSPPLAMARFWDEVYHRPGAPLAQEA